MRTGRFLHVADRVDGDPSVSGRYARIRAAFEDGGEHVPVFFALWTPVRRGLCQDAVVLKPGKWVRDFITGCIPKCPTRL